MAEDSDVLEMIEEMRGHIARGLNAFDERRMAACRSELGQAWQLLRAWDHTMPWDEHPPGQGPSPLPLLQEALFGAPPGQRDAWLADHLQEVVTVDLALLEVRGTIYGWMLSQAASELDD